MKEGTEITNEETGIYERNEKEKELKWQLKELEFIKEMKWKKDLECKWRRWNV